MKYDRDRHHRRSIRLKDYDYTRVGAYFITLVTQDRACVLGDVIDGEVRLTEAGRMVEAVWHALPAHYPGVGVDAFVVMPNHLHGIILLGDFGEAAGAAPRGRPVGEGGGAPLWSPRPGQAQGPVGQAQGPVGQAQGPAPTDDADGEGGGVPLWSPGPGQAQGPVGQAQGPVGQAQGPAPTDDADGEGRGDPPWSPRPGQARGPAPTGAADGEGRGDPLWSPRPAPTVRLSLADVVHRFKTLTTRRYIDGVHRQGWPGFRRRLWLRNYYEHIIRTEAELARVRAYIADNPLRWSLDEENPKRPGG